MGARIATPRLGEVCFESFPSISVSLSLVCLPECVGAQSLHYCPPRKGRRVRVQPTNVPSMSIFRVFFFGGGGRQALILVEERYLGRLPSKRQLHHSLKFTDSQTSLSVSSWNLASGELAPCIELREGLFA